MPAVIEQLKNLHGIVFSSYIRNDLVETITPLFYIESRMGKAVFGNQFGNYFYNSSLFLLKILFYGKK